MRLKEIKPGMEHDGEFIAVHEVVRKVKREKL